MWIVHVFLGVIVGTSDVQVTSFPFLKCQYEAAHFDPYRRIVLCFVLFQICWFFSKHSWYTCVTLFRLQAECKCCGFSLLLLQPFHSFEVYWVWSCWFFVWGQNHKVKASELVCKLNMKLYLWIPSGGATLDQKVLCLLWHLLMIFDSSTVECNEITLIWHGKAAVLESLSRLCQF
jgi:hypothetical protein